MITTLLQSDEQLDFSAIDDEGRTARDICPYNSPIFKILCKYEEQQFRLLPRLRSGGPSEITGSKIQINHFYINRKFYESPTRLRQKIIAQAQQDRGRTKNQLYNNNNCFKYQSVGPNTQKSFKNQTQIISENKKQSNYHSRAQSHHGREFNSMKQSLQLNEDLISSNDDEFSHRGILTPSGQYSGNYSLVSNFIRGHSTNNYDLKQRDITMFNYSDLKQAEQMNFKILSSLQIQPPDDPHSPSVLNDSRCQNTRNLSPKRLQPINETYFSSQTSKKQATLQKAIDVHDKEQSVEKERFEDEDDANVPEEENEADVEIQKSNMRVFNKSPSVNAFHNNAQHADQDFQLMIVQNIIKEVEQQREKMSFQQLFHKSIDQRETIQTSVLLQTYNKSSQNLKNINTAADLINLEQGGKNQQQGTDLSQNYLVNEESMSIQVPIDDRDNNKNSTTIGLQSHKYFRSDNDLHKNQDQLWKIYQNLFYNIYHGNKVLISDTFKDVASIFQVDYAYYNSQNMLLSGIKQYLNKYLLNSEKQSILMNYYLFELINSYEIKLYEKQQRLKQQFSDLESQRLVNQTKDYVNDCSSSQRSNALQTTLSVNYQHAPNLKVKLHKSPSFQQISALNQQNSKSVESRRQELMIGIMANNSDAIISSQTLNQVNISQRDKKPVYDIKYMIQSQRSSLDISSNQKKFKPAQFCQTPQMKTQKYDKYSGNLSHKNQRPFQQDNNIQLSQSQTIQPNRNYKIKSDSKSHSKRSSVHKFQQNFEQLFPNESQNSERSNQYLKKKNDQQKVVQQTRESKYLKTLESQKILKQKESKSNLKVQTDNKVQKLSTIDFRRQTPIQKQSTILQQNSTSTLKSMALSKKYQPVASKTPSKLQQARKSDSLSNSKSRNSVSSIFNSENKKQHSFQRPISQLSQTHTLIKQKSNKKVNDLEYTMFVSNTQRKNSKPNYNYSNKNNGEFLRKSNSNFQIVFFNGNKGNNQIEENQQNKVILSEHPNELRYKRQPQIKQSHVNKMKIVQQNVVATKPMLSNNNKHSSQVFGYDSNRSSTFGGRILGQSESQYLTASTQNMSSLQPKIQTKAVGDKVFSYIAKNKSTNQTPLNKERKIRINNYEITFDQSKRDTLLISQDTIRINEEQKNLFKNLSQLKIKNQDL